MIVGILTTCHTQYTWDRSICLFLFNRTTLQVFVTYLTGALYVHPLSFYKHQLDNRVRSTQNAFSLPFADVFVNCAPSGEMHNYCTPHIIKENFENFLIHRCNYILLSQVYCVWQVVKTQTIIFNTLRTGDADLRFYVTTVQDGWGRFAFLRYNCAGRVTQICVFNTVKLGTSASSPYCHSTRGNVSIGITPSSTTRVFGEYFLKISVHKNS